MRIIDNQETLNWLNERRLLDSKAKLTFSGFLNPISFAIPVDSGSKTSLSRVIASSFETRGESLLWINEFGIWPSCEDYELFKGYRQSLNEFDTLHKKPGHVFTNNDLIAVQSLTAMVLYFIWGAVITTASADRMIRISHDEFIDVYAKDNETLLTMNEKLSVFLKLKTR